MIPRHLHFLWGFLGDGFPLAEREAGNLDQWCKMHPHWQVDVHAPAEIEPMIPQRLSTTYEQLSTAIQRCDFVRPILLGQAGGVYSDLDVHPRKPLDRLFEKYPGASVLLVEEVTLSRGSSIRRGKRHAIREGQPELRLRVANFWMASAAGHPFWDHVIELIEQRKHLQKRDDYDVIFTTGPDVISEVYDQYKETYADVQLVPRRQARKFFRHQAHGSWRT